MYNNPQLEKASVKCDFGVILALAAIALVGLLLQLKFLLFLQGSRKDGRKLS